MISYAATSEFDVKSDIYKKKGNSPPPAASALSNKRFDTDKEKEESAHSSS